MLRWRRRRKVQRVTSTGLCALVVRKDVYNVKSHEGELDKLAAETAAVKGTVSGKTAAVESRTGKKRLKSPASESHSLRLRLASRSPIPEHRQTRLEADAQPVSA